MRKVMTHLREMGVSSSGSSNGGDGWGGGVGGRMLGRGGRVCGY